jgi:hypothetical protein
METKQCSTCKEIKTIDRFIKDSRYKNGFRGQCRECIQKKQKERYYKEWYLYREKDKVWREKTPELTEQRRIRTYIKYLISKGYKIIEPE